MNRLNKALYILLVSLVGSLLTTSCAKKDFTSAAVSASSVSGQGSTSGSTSANGTGQSCNLQTLTVPIKVLFIVDTSGSNGVWTQSRGTAGCTSPSHTGCAPATDPSKTFRYGSMSDFFNTVQTKTNFSWDIETFSDSANDLGNGFGNASAMTTDLNMFKSISDSNDTNYLSALSAAQSMIANDPDLHSNSSTPTLYRIIFLSDGYPTDALNKDGSVNMTTLNAAISSIIALAPNQIQLSSVYYGTINDPTASSTLQAMATTGGGQFINADTSSTSAISVNDLITIGSAQCK